MDAAHADTSTSPLLRSFPEQINTDHVLSMYRARNADVLKPRGHANDADSIRLRPDQKLFCNDEQIAELLDLLAASRYDEALLMAKSIANRYPLQGLAWHVLGAILLQRGEIDEAVRHLKTAIVLLPADAEAYNNYGCALERQGRLLEAELAYRHAVRINVNFVQAHHNLGVVQRTLGHYQESALSLHNAIQIKPDYPNAHFNLGLTLSCLSRNQDAEHHLRIALKLKPDHISARVALGGLLGKQARLQESELMLNSVFAIDPNNLDAWSGLAQLRKLSLQDHAWFNTAEQIAQQPLDAPRATRYCQTMSKYYDDVGDYAKAFEHAQRANQLSSLRLPFYDPDREAAQTERVLRKFDKYRPAGLQSLSSDRPVFLIGMPGAGTTLLARQLALHPLIADGGELLFWKNAMVQIMAMTLNKELEPATIAYLADNYSQILDQVSHTALRVIDHAPENFRNLGLIHAVFPRARIIHVRRPPIDTCWSMYMHQVNVPLNCSSELTSLVHYYRQYQRCMEHWRAVLPDAQILDVPHQELVDNPAPWIRTLVEFIGLEWNSQYDALLQHAVAPAESRVGLAHDYQAYIGPLRELLDER